MSRVRPADPDPFAVDWLDDAPGASYAPPQLDHLALTPRTARSWGCTDVRTLEAWLAQRHYDPLDVRSPHEAARLRKRNRLIVLYHSGSVVAQGDDWQGAVRELSHLVPIGGEA